MRGHTISGYQVLEDHVVGIKRGLDLHRPARVHSNIELATAVMPAGLWDRLEQEGLINLAPPDHAPPLMSPKFR